MSDRSRKTIIVILLILGLGVCMTGIPIKSHQTDYSGHADPSLRYTQIEQIQPFTSGVVTANTDDPEELTVLPGIGETIASAWVTEYLENGLFFYPEDLLSVRGIGEKKLEALKPLLDFSAIDR